MVLCSGCKVCFSVIRLVIIVLKLLWIFGMVSVCYCVFRGGSFFIVECNVSNVCCNWLIGVCSVDCVFFMLCVLVR